VRSGSYGGAGGKPRKIDKLVLNKSQALWAKYSSFAINGQWWFKWCSQCCSSYWTVTVGFISWCYKTNISIRRIKLLNATNKKLHFKLRAAQKRCHRLRKKAVDVVTPTNPRSKSEYLISRSSSKMRKTLIFHHALVQELHNKQQFQVSPRETNIVKGFVWKNTKEMQVTVNSKLWIWIAMSSGSTLQE